MVLKLGQIVTIGLYLLPILTNVGWLNPCLKKSGPRFRAFCQMCSTEIIQVSIITSDDIKQNKSWKKIFTIAFTQNYYFVWNQHKVAHKVPR